VSTALIEDLNDDIMKTIQKKFTVKSPKPQSANPAKIIKKKPMTSNPSKRTIFVDSLKPPTEQKVQRPLWSATTRLGTSKLRKDYLQIAKEKEEREQNELEAIVELVFLEV